MDKAKRNFLNDDNVDVIINEWDSKTPADFAKNFGVGVNTVNLMAKEINKINNELCKPKKRSRKTRKSIAESAVSRYVAKV